MCWGQLIGVGANAGQSALQGGQDADTLNANADILDLKAADALKRGGIAEDIQRNKTAQTMGFQRAVMGSSGVQVDSGSSGKVLEQTTTMGELDAQTIRSNSLRESWGYTNEAENARAQAIAAGVMQRALLPGTEKGGLSTFDFIPNKRALGFNPGGVKKYISTGKG